MCVIMDHKTSVLKQHLVNLGYNQDLPRDAVPLVDKILSDLIHTTKNLKYYKQKSEQLEKEYNDFQYGVEPYKCDNAKLLNENNNLNLQLMKAIEENDKIQRNFKHQIRILEQHLSKAKSQICKLEYELSKRHTRKTSISSLQTKDNKNNCTTIMSSQNRNRNKYCTREYTCQCEKLLKQTELEIANLNTEVTQLKDDNRLQSEMIDSYKAQLRNRDNEIERLMSLLKNGRPYQALSKECCYKDVDEKISLLTKKVSDLENEKVQLELKLTEAIMKQHDAMKNAVNLAEKNHQLENELMEIDRMALTVESDCNKAVRENNEKMFSLQRQLNDATNKLREMEKQNEFYENEHKKMEHKIQCLMDEKQSLMEKINQFSVIEYDLNAEVDRLTKIMVQQKHQIEDFETQLKNAKTSPTDFCKKTSIPKFSYNKDSKFMNTKICGNDTKINSEQQPSSPKTSECCTGCRCKTENGEALKNCLHTINRLQTERDYYWREYERMRSNWEKNSSNEMNLIEIRRKLNEKEQVIQSLQEDLRDLSRNKHNLEMQLHEMKDADRWMGRMKTDNRVNIKKLELERDIAMGDCRRLEEERNDLRCRLQMAHDLQQSEAKRYEEMIQDLECRLRQLEDERHNIVLETGNRGATITKLEEKLCQYKQNLKDAECEVMRLQQCCAQQKGLIDQSESRVNELECMNCDLEKNYKDAMCRIKEMENEIDLLKSEISALNTENQTLQTKICKLVEEQDCLMARLDGKTEEVECLRDQLRKKDNCLQILEGQQRVLQEQLNDALDQLQSNQNVIKCLETELNELKRNLCAADKSKECLLEENRALQNELSQLTGDFQCVNKNYELAQQQIEDLKQQLQGYICEVSRIEDLLDQKEKQRDAMLADFRQLSAEANILENNNCSLENEACHVKHELQNANEKICELKDALERNECLIKSYCQQIQALTSSVAGLECEIAQVTQQRDAAEKLCAKLERQNDELINELAAKDEQKCQCECELKMIKQEFNDLKMQFSDKLDEICQLEDQLCKAREETNYNRMLKDELQNEVNDLNRIVDRLQCKLEESRCNIAKYRSKIIELQDDIVNLTSGRAELCDSDC